MPGALAGGLTAKIHPPVDAKSLPLGLRITPGRPQDGQATADMLEKFGEEQLLLADRAYDSNALHQAMEQRGAWVCIKPIQGRFGLPAFGPLPYRYRSLVGRFFNPLKHLRSLQHATDSIPTTTSPRSSSPQLESGCALVSQ